MDLSKEEWYPIVYDALIDSGDKFDTLTILATHPSFKYKKSGKSIPIWSVNYKTTEGNWSTGFGVVEIKKSELDKYIRDSKLRRILK
jgi:hypothetical protein